MLGADEICKSRPDVVVQNDLSGDRGRENLGVEARPEEGCIAKDCPIGGGETIDVAGDQRLDGVRQRFDRLVFLLHVFVLEHS